MQNTVVNHNLYNDLLCSLYAHWASLRVGYEIRLVLELVLMVWSSGDQNVIFHVYYIIIGTCMLTLT